MKTDRPILLLEDDDVDVLTVRRALRQLKITNELVVAGNGEEALERLRGQSPLRPGIVLLDLNMPRMSGLEFLRRVREEGLARGVPVVVLTTSKRDRDIVEGFDLNVAGYIVKPVDYSRFLAAVALIDRYWTLSELPA